MFTMALLIKGKSWEQPKCSTMWEWLIQLWYLYASVYKAGTDLYLHMWEDVHNLLQNESISVQNSM